MNESHIRTLAALRKWSVLLDSAFRVPGTNVTFGLDPILGLIPGLGDLTSPVFAAWLLVHAVRMRIPRVDPTMSDSPQSGARLVPICRNHSGGIDVPKASSCLWLPRREAPANASPGLLVSGIRLPPKQRKRATCLEAVASTLVALLYDAGHAPVSFQPHWASSLTRLARRCS